MRAVEQGQLLVERGTLTVRVLGGADGVTEAIGILDDAEAVAGAPLVDESERDRLSKLERGEHDALPDHWHPLLARRDGTALGYAGVVLPRGGEATGDLAADRGRPECGQVTSALFAGVQRVADAHGASRAVVWIRHAQPDDRDHAAAAGFDVHRRLLVLGRRLDDDIPAPQLPAGWSTRSYIPDADDEAVVTVLADAFAGTPDAGWDLARLAERRAFDWFEPADLLVAEDDEGHIRAVHWTKQRGDGVGEVYVLGVGPGAQGRGVGLALLRAGLRHLAARGCSEVLLWVDEDNRSAVRLYEREAFTRRWADVAFAARR